MAHGWAQVLEHKLKEALSREALSATKAAPKETAKATQRRLFDAGGPLWA